MKYIKHFLTILKHKWYVGIECFKMGLYWQGIVHDLSKFHPIEFCESAKFYIDGSHSPIDDIKKYHEYSKAWIHHKAINKHHWQYWIDFKNGEPFAVTMPTKYIKEMACDMIGASKTYKNLNPYDYFLANEKNWIMEHSSKLYLRELLYRYNYNL